MPFVAYALYSEKYNKHYYGYASDLPGRFLSHNELGKDWTAKYCPWKIIYTKEFLTKPDAMVHE